ncbi:MAG: Mrp/NBP35 family ATP-binding protein [Anaplasmataceae bacterium]|nr:Mrp/NBP35 family ATP-binding protein [Anaplasmataceae bacterium]
MTEELKNKVIDILKSINNPFENESDIIKSGIIADIKVSASNIKIFINIIHSDQKSILRYQQLKMECEKTLHQSIKNYEISIILINDKTLKKKIPNIKKIILVGSGKGGVGKSTVAYNLAINLANAGHNIGLLDADIYGSSSGILSGLIANKTTMENKKILPLEINGISLMSISMIVKNTEKAFIWRGPMISKALNQMLLSTEWGEKDFLIVDMPPGTGDVHLSMAEFNITGAIVVSTPQLLAISDAIKYCNMMEVLNIPLIGLIENMSYLLHNEEKIELFGKSYIHLITDKFCNSLGTIPFEQNIAIASDAGIKIKNTQYYTDITKKVLSILI